ncbi:MAG: hypothetical protein SOZ34_05540 [Clostridia bacterium]|nr:hypothetical protein [Clostridia bacterium]
MKKLISGILLICILTGFVNISYAYNEEGKIVIAKPVITVGLSDEAVDTPVVGLNSVRTYIFNNSESDVTAELSAIVGGNQAGSVRSTVKQGESRMLSVGFYLASNEESVEFEIKNADTGELYTDFEAIPVNEDFRIGYTNAKDDFAIDNTVIFEFNSIVKEIGEIDFIQNNTAVDFEKSVTVNNGKTILCISPDIALLSKAIVQITLPEIKDVFGRVIEKQKIIFKVSDVVKEFEVYQRAKVYNQAGIGGFAMLADFEDNTPQKVCFERKTFVPSYNHDANLPFRSSAVAVVIDPNGRIAAKYDFSDMPSGKQNVVIEIPYRVEGIWQFKFTSSRNGDILGIGLPTAKNWGIRGETMLGVTETTPLSSYIYVPEKVNNLYVGSSSASVSVYNSDNELQMTTTGINKNLVKSEGEITNIEGESIYRLDISENFSGGIIVDYAPSLMCPTMEMAQNLKGGWIDVQGVLVQGSIQKAARELLIKYINEKNFDITYEKPSYVRGTLEYPEAEALLFGGGGPISNVKKYSDKQNFNISSPYCGSFVSEDTATWEDGSFYTTSTQAFSGLVNMDGQLNAFYHHEGLINRTVISILASLVMLSEDVMIKDNPISSDVPITHGNFYFSYTASAYMWIREFVDEETKAVIDNAMIQLAVKQGDMPGRGPTNQWLFTAVGVASAAYATNDETVKGILGRHLCAVTSEPIYDKGQSAAGYFIEGGGCDGDYHNLSRDLFFELYETIQKKDPANKYLNYLNRMIQKNTEFYSLFVLPNDNGYFMTNACTSRTLHNMGIDSHTTYTKIMDEFPLAKRRFELLGRDEAWANEIIHKYIGPYDNFSDRAVSGNCFQFEAYKKVKSAEPESELLPYECNSGIWEKPGIIAVKHMGLYMNIFYTVPERNTLPEMSFMGGGISLLYGDGTETVVASQKHDNYSSITSYDQIRASCVFGKKKDDSIFVTGKEKAELTWLESGKRFKIQGCTPDGIDVSWIYTLTDDGISQRVTASGDTSEMWLNIPVSNVNENAVLTQKQGGIEYKINGSCISFDWDRNREYYLTELDGVRYLRINMSDGDVTVNMKHDEKEVYIEKPIFSETDNEIFVTIKNKTEEEKSAVIIFALYSENGKLDSINISDKVYLDKDVSKTIDMKISDYTGKETLKIMVWNSPEGMLPLDLYEMTAE